MLDTIYLSKEIFNWQWDIFSLSVCDSGDVLRAYEIFNHAESLITKNATNFNLADSLSNLKRALNHRLQLIERLFKLRSVKFADMPNGYLELLETYGLVRPYLIKKLMEIRNDIEHRDANPPDIERCKELLDVTWYFLKSTDKLVSYIPTDIELEPSNDNQLPDKYGCSIEINYSNSPFSVQGWFPATYFLDEKVDNVLKVICNTIHDGHYWKGKDNNSHKDKTKDDIWIVGSFDITNIEKLMLFKKTFELL